MIHEVAISTPPYLTGDGETSTACTPSARRFGNSRSGDPLGYPVGPALLDLRDRSPDRGDGARDELDGEKQDESKLPSMTFITVLHGEVGSK
jgi:hypothetical protein